MSSEPANPNGGSTRVKQLVDTHAISAAEQSHYLRIYKSNVFVRDHDRSIRFYVDQLGFSMVADGRFDFGRWVAIAPPDGNAILALLAPKRGSVNYKLIGRPTHIGFLAEDVYATYRLWLSRGVQFLHPPQPQLWGGTFASFCDVDGNTFDLLGSDEMSQDIEARRRALAEKLEAERRTARELEIAKQVQARLFPQALPALTTLDYAGLCIQAQHVGGDYYDFVALGPDRLGLLIGDISGKGIAAALLMANLQANLRSQFAMAREQPHQYLRCVNRLFYDNTVDSAYATVFFAEYHDATQRLQYTNCGHLSGLLLRRDHTVEWLDSTGTVLGLFKDWDGPSVECRLSPNDTLVLYTDGVTESFNAAGEEFGEQRLVEAVRRHCLQPAQTMVGSIVADLQRFSSGEQHDDITLIVAKCRA
jgi:serine phosphatase RsbU (regulator of sigma subunit)/catechol 2,3-dioxygenase-like lactoylglutathione lyase family enzyme